MRRRKSFVFFLRLHPSPSSAPEKSLVPPQDPEQSLTEYIHRLEVIQQRLGGVQPGKNHLLTPHSSCKSGLLFARIFVHVANKEHNFKE